MNIHMFGSKSIKSKSDLKKVNIPTGSSAHAEDIWSTGEQDALHIPILGSEAHQSQDDNHSKPELLNPFGVYISEEAKNEDVMLSSIEESKPPLLEDGSILDDICAEAELLLEELPTLEPEKALEPASEETERTEIVQEEALSEELMHAPIPTPLVEECTERVVGVYASSELYVKSLSKELALYCDAEIHCFDSSMNEAQLQDDTRINMWIVNLSDDDESELLDSILEESAEHPTLYLSGSLSKHCKKRIQAFLEEN